MKIQFQMPAFNLEDSENSFINFKRKIDKAILRLEHFETSSTLSASLEHIKNELRLLPEPSSGIISKRHLRAFISLLNESDYRTNVNITEQTLSRIDDLKYPPSKSILDGVIRLFFDRFDNLTNFYNIRFWILKSKQARGKSHTEDHFLFDEKGPTFLANLAKSCPLKETQEIFSTLLKQYRLPSIAAGRFYDKFYAAYYIERVNALPATTNDPLLKEIEDPRIHNRVYEKQPLGIILLKPLIDRSGTKEINPHWKQTVLNVAGDPRLKSSARHRSWWSLLGEERERKVRQWIVGSDIQLFLRILSESGDKSGYEDRMRMFPPRKKFIEGLFYADLIEDSRLFLCPVDAAFIKNICLKKRLPEPQFAVLTGGDGHKSIIYLKLPSSAHLLEGTHSCKIRVTDKIPSDVTDWSYSELSYYQLTSGVDYHSNNTLAQPHLNNWQHKVIYKLQELGIHIRASQVI